MAQVHRLVAARDFDSTDQVRAYLDTLVGQLPTAAPTTPAERAEDIVYAAWEAPAAFRADRARQALAIDPDCVDAVVLLAAHTSDPGEADRLWEQAAAMGQRRLEAPDRPSAEDGDAWADPTTRPALRARLGRAMHRRAQGDLDAAVADMEELLRLDPDDHQGVRYVLAPTLLSLGRDGEAAALLDRFADDESADWAYHRLLLTLRRGAAEADRRRLLRAARKRNEDVPAYLLGEQAPPDPLPDILVRGEDSEAAVYAALAGQAWEATPDALDWLAAEVEPWDVEGAAEEDAWASHPEFRAIRETDADEVIVGDSNPRFHVLMHAVVARQLARADPPAAAELLEACLRAGAGRHEAEHVILNVLVRAMSAMLREGRLFDGDRYEAQLRLLTRLASGEAPPPRPRRSDPCPCGSGAKARDCCLPFGWPPLPMITPPDGRPPRPGLVSVLGPGRFAEPAVLRNLTQDDPLVFCENATAVAEGLEAAGDPDAALGVLQEVAEAAGAAHERVALEQLARLCLRHPDHEAEGRRACARLSDLTGEPADAVMRRLMPPWRRR